VAQDESEPNPFADEGGAASSEEEPSPFSSPFGEDEKVN